jgi:hypothetical protein
MRKIIQIAVASGSDGNEEVSGWCPLLLALCDDGTLWSFDLDDREENEWSPLPSVPQE